MAECTVDEAQGYTWRMTQGDDSTRVFIYRDAEGDPIDLTGCTATLYIDMGLDDFEVDAVLDPLLGKMTVKIVNEVSVLLKGTGAIRLRLTQSGGDVLTLVKGVLVVTP